MSRMKIVVTEYKNFVLYFLKDDNGPVEIQFFENGADAVGNIYLCEIKDVVKNIGASFINYGKGKKGFLKSTDYKVGDTVPLQLVKIPGGLKDPVFSSELTIGGTFVAITNKNKKLAYSHKLSEDKKKELEFFYSEIFSDLEYGIILRTNSVNAGFKELVTEADELAGTLDNIVSYSGNRTIGSVLYEKEDEWINYCLRINPESIDEIVTDNEVIYEKIKNMVYDTVSKVNPNVTLKLYNDKVLPLLSLHSFKNALSDALNTKVWLKSGGFLMIERTEALVAIDVNTGKMVNKTSNEDTVYICNMEATIEIARQLRLRNLSGIIIIDYINMKDEEHITAIINKLKELTANDCEKVTYHDLTKLFLVELTRVKSRETLAEQYKKIEG